MTGAVARLPLRWLRRMREVSLISGDHPVASGVAAEMKVGHRWSAKTFPGRATLSAAPPSPALCERVHSGVGWHHWRREILTLDSETLVLIIVAEVDRCHTRHRRRPTRGKTVLCDVSNLKVDASGSQPLCPRTRRGLQYFCHYELPQRHILSQTRKGVSCHPWQLEVTRRRTSRSRL